MIVLASILGPILATGILALNPSMIGNAQAELYANEYGYDNNYYQDDAVLHNSLFLTHLVNLF